MKTPFTIIISEMNRLYADTRKKDVGTLKYYIELLSLIIKNDCLIAPFSLEENINKSISSNSDQEEIAKTIWIIENTMKPWKPKEKRRKNEYDLDYNSLLLLSERIHKHLKIAGF